MQLAEQKGISKKGVPVVCKPHAKARSAKHCHLWHEKQQKRCMHDRSLMAHDLRCYKSSPNPLQCCMTCNVQCLAASYGPRHCVHLRHLRSTLQASYLSAGF